MSSSHHAFDALLEQGSEQLKAGALEEAIETFSTAVALDPQNPMGFRGRGAAHFQLKLWAQAEADFSAAKKNDEQNPENWSDLALSKAMQNKVYEAIALFDQALEKWPEFVQGYIQLGILQIKVGAVTHGRDILKKGLASRPNLNQRRMIESLLKEQDKLDKNRYYRPDFERLRKESTELFFVGWIRKLFGSLKKKTKPALTQ